MRISYKLGVIALALTLPLAACESDEDLDVVVTPFAAPLNALNSAAGGVIGTATVEIAGDLLRITVNASGLDSVSHVQFIATGSSCPDITADTNADGLIDIQEGAVAFGQPMLFLDNTLAVREDSLGTFQATDSVTYTQTAVFSEVEQSLRGSDNNDITADLPVNGDFNPENMTVLILGTSRPLPGTLAVLGTLSPGESLPVACGVLHRVITN